MAIHSKVVVLGGGPGGYAAAFLAADLGLETTIVEYDPRLGGTCLLRGCIPSKALLATSEEFEKASLHLPDHGISVGNVAIDIAKMQARKDGIVSKMTKGIEFLFRKNKITWLKGNGKLVGTADGMFRVQVSDADSVDVNEALNVVVATGSKARHLPGVPVDNQLVCDNEGALVFPEVPKRLVVIGGGPVGCELSQALHALGTREVTMLVAGDRLLERVEPLAGELLTKSLQ